ncbi:DUF4382 domain-containing protein [Gelidibacter salicanalis]|uniref:DUF4382 domain-containing protein n=1 Tax=Gelidibacter salicanalis TaxID=291193 RepID=A0A934KUI9_9FLAO|nr:DUF4382 domain-containing protein [Gelidibacter salicanalis]MBJ7880917.1 DUF4382 domain-containing protein [Gelidibacter salicanalis]
MNVLKKASLLALITFFSFGCSDDDAANDAEGNAKVSIKLMDAPGDYEHVYIDIVDVMVKVNDNGDGEEGWQSLNAINTGVYDLLTLTGGVNVLLVDDFEVLSGTLNQIRLILGDDNTVVIDGETFPLKTPSAQQSGLKIKLNQTLLPNTAYTFLLDFDVDKSIVIAGNSGNINLKPVIRASAEATTGTISGSVLPLGVQTQISATNGVDVVTTYADANGNFLLLGLTAGSYTVTVTPNPASQLTPSILKNVEVTVEKDTSLGVITIK